MARTTTAFNACGNTVQLDDSGDTLRDISGSSIRLNWQLSIDLGDFKVFGEAGRGRLACGKDTQVQVDFIKSETTLEAWALFKDWFDNNHTTPRSLQVDSPDASNPSDRLSGEFYLQDLSWPEDASEAAPIPVSATLMIDGDLTIATIP